MAPLRGAGRRGDGIPGCARIASDPGLCCETPSALAHTTTRHLTSNWEVLEVEEPGCAARARRTGGERLVRAEKEAATNHRTAEARVQMPDGSGKLPVCLARRGSLTPPKLTTAGLPRDLRPSVERVARSGDRPQRGARLPVCPSARLPVCPSARLPVCPSARLPVCPSARFCPSARLPVCPSARLPVCPSARLPVCILCSFREGWSPNCSEITLACFLKSASRVSEGPSSGCRSCGRWEARSHTAGGCR